jgi:aspartyl-tRNA(Asn)/glutamyl-tRNA(Gln) amidotransferase subunit A
LRERPQDYGAQVHARIELGLAYPATHYLRALQLRPALIRRFSDAVFSRCDVLHTPVLPVPVPTIAETDLESSPGFTELLAGLTRCTRPINYLGFPGLTVPCGFSGNGLPVAFQLVGRPFAEQLLYRTAAAYETATGWTHKMPPDPEQHPDRTA